MATRRFGISRGENIDQVYESVGAATTYDDIELTVDLATITGANGKERVLLALEQLEAYIIKSQWPPA